MLVQAEIPVKSARVGILGLTFKEDVHDIRNSKVPRHRRGAAGSSASIPSSTIRWPIPRRRTRRYGLHMSPFEAVKDLDAVIFAVSHRAFLDMGIGRICGCLRPKSVFVDVKSCFSPKGHPRRDRLLEPLMSRLPDCLQPAPGAPSPLARDGRGRLHRLQPPPAAPRPRPGSGRPRQLLHGEAGQPRRREGPGGAGGLVPLPLHRGGHPQARGLRGPPAPAWRSSSTRRPSGPCPAPSRIPSPSPPVQRGRLPEHAGRRPATPG